MSEQLSSKNDDFNLSEKGAVAEQYTNLSPIVGACQSRLFPNIFFSVNLAQKAPDKPEQNLSIAYPNNIGHYLIEHMQINGLGPRF